MRSVYSTLVNHLEERLRSCGIPVMGCSVVEIAEVRERQKVERLPILYTEFLSRMGRTERLGNHLESVITYPHMLEFKDATFEPLQNQNLFVLKHDYQGDCAIYFQVDVDDPVLYWIGYERDEVKKFSFNTHPLVCLSDWLIDLVGDLVDKCEGTGDYLQPKKE